MDWTQVINITIDINGLTIDSYQPYHHINHWTKAICTYSIPQNQTISYSKH